MRKLPAGWVGFSLGLVLAFGCSKGSEDDDDRDGTGATAGASSTGGATTSGSSTGGAMTGGSSSGGLSNRGGNQSGGRATGGDADAGDGNGGSTSGGGVSGGRGGRAGGTSSGGARGGSGGRSSGGASTGGARSGSGATGGARGGSGATGGGSTSATGGAATGGVAGNTNGGQAGEGHSTGGVNTGGGGTGGAGTGICGANEGQLFNASHPWNQRIDAAGLDAESDEIIDYLQRNHTAEQRFRIDGPSDETDNVYGIVVLYADASTPREPFSTTDEFYEPDCDPAAVPIPSGGFIEGETGYQCESDGDCHLIVVDEPNCRLYEMWRANRTATEFYGGCQAVWDLTQTYEPTLRGDCCTSADAAGLPIAAHMFDADEIFAGEIPHAIRFILPNDLMRASIYVRPATHSTPSTSGPANAPPYGARMRLKDSFDPSGLKPAAQVVATALKEYGMILSDGGNLTFTAANDRLTTHKWAEVDLMPGDLTSLEWTDFEVVELGTRYNFDECECERTPIED